MSIETLITDPTVLADAQAAAEAAISGKKLDAEVVDRIRNRAKKIRDEIWRRHGTLDVGVPAIREFRDR